MNSHSLVRYIDATILHFLQKNLNVVAKWALEMMLAS
jgi:hypothetical protein